MKYRAKSSLISIIITVIVVLIGLLKNNIIIQEQKSTEEFISDSKIAITFEEYNLKDDLMKYIIDNYATFKLYTETFGIELNTLTDELLSLNENNTLNYNDIANTGETYETLDKQLIDYLFKLEKEKPSLFNKKLVSNNMSKEYIYSLIDYFSNVYGNVDSTTLKGIAYIESGNLSAKYMMKHNNIFGGMSSKGLISYRNINYGVLSYVKLMSESYYGKGLTTLETIGKKYNPVEINNKKIANPTWVTNIKNVLNKFEERKITIEELYNLV